MCRNHERMNTGEFGFNGNHGRGMGFGSGCERGSFHDRPVLWREFLTRGERVDLLERYRSWLENEIKGLTEYMGELRKK